MSNPDRDDGAPNARRGDAHYYEPQNADASPPASSLSTPRISYHMLPEEDDFSTTTTLVRGMPSDEDTAVLPPSPVLTIEDPILPVDPFFTPYTPALWPMIFWLDEDANAFFLPPPAISEASSEPLHLDGNAMVADAASRANADDGEAASPARSADALAHACHEESSRGVAWAQYRAPDHFDMYHTSPLLIALAKDDARKTL
ncbi:hypothetical protein OH76DRAFT_1418220 [Lentinus brumalis]|uniref:Uncharacterized protein n=1 Tax=Lentinus brumalis TaxID=2498619 RepID=A0A371DAY1_9APHY|nr:hypothetical protein OH76DRAFT_1418220 [Polyporus brumalis]